MAVTGFWPGQVPFDIQDMNTVIAVLNEQAKQVKR